jgi:hypothetical protein
MITPELVASVFKEPPAKRGQANYAVTQEVGLALANSPEAVMFCFRLSLRSVEKSALLPADVLEPKNFQRLTAQQLHQFITPAMHLVIAGYRLAKAELQANGVGRDEALGKRIR